MTRLTKACGSWSIAKSSQSAATISIVSFGSLVPKSKVVNERGGGGASLRKAEVALALMA
jgi:hypothetical protein